MLQTLGESFIQSRLLIQCLQRFTAPGFFHLTEGVFVGVYAGALHARVSFQRADTDRTQ